MREVVVLPLPVCVTELAQAAEHFAEQYHCQVHIEVKGHICLEGSLYCELPGWSTVLEMDQELDLLGLGPLGEELEEEDFLWVIPTGPGEVRLSQLL